MDLNNKTTLGNVKVVMLKGEKGETGHGALVAKTVADMVDRFQIYVYVGNETGYTFGNWYYYNGSAWVSGGVYNTVAVALDDTLTVEGEAADAKAAGDAIRAVKNVLVRSNDLLPLPLSFYYPDPEVTTFSVWNDMPVNSFYVGIPTRYKDSISAPIEWDDEYSEYLILKISDQVSVISPEKRLLYIGQKTGNVQKWISGINETDTALTESGVAADAKATGDQFFDYNAKNILPLKNTEYINEGVSFTPENGGYIVNGTPTNPPVGYAYRNLWSATNNGQLPGIIPGEKYYVKYSGVNVRLCIFAVGESGIIQTWRTYTDKEITIPENSTKTTVRLEVLNETTADNEFVKVSIVNTLTNKELDYKIDATATELNDKIDKAEEFSVKDVMPYNNVGGSSYGVTYTPENGGYTVNGTAASTQLNYSYYLIYQDQVSGMVSGETYHVIFTGENVRLRIFAAGTGVEWKIKHDTDITLPENFTHLTFRLEVMNGDTAVNEFVKPIILTAPTNKQLDEKIDAINDKISEKLRVLLIGNSFSYSTCGYLPRLLHITNPDLDITFAILYDSGASISQHINYFVADTKHSKFSVYNSANDSYVNYTNAYTTKEALNYTDWDFICLQESSSATNNITYLITFCNLINSYIATLTNPYNYSFLFNFSHVLGANDPDLKPVPTDPPAETASNNQYEQKSIYVQAALNTPYILDILPGGTAIQNARQIETFKEIGEKGYLCCDDVSHLQNGIAPLISAYANLYKLMQLIGRKTKTFNIDFAPTDANLEAMNLYTANLHGNCEGVTVDNMLLGQKCAIAALKKPFEITTF